MLSIRVLPLLVLCCLAAACEKKEARAELSPAAAPSKALPLDGQSKERSAPKPPPQLPRSSHPGVAALTAALEHSDLPAARLAAAGVDELGDLDARLALARLRFAEGDQIAAVRLVEEARQAHPRQGRVYATAAELDAWAGRSQSAEDEVREGLAECGPSPDLLRARGVLALCRTGGAQLALEHLLSAREQDPALPFLLRPLAQAHVLLGSASMASEPPDMLSALGHAAAALKVLPDEPDALRLLADCHSALGEFEEAVRLYEQLIAAGDGAAGHACAQLLPRAATAAMFLGDRNLALRHYLRARELGLPQEELGFGAQLLVDEAVRALDRGVALAEQGNLAAAGELFRSALEYDPQSLEARGLLGTILFKQGDYEGAAAAWTTVLEAARARQLELPEPVHLDLARALRKLGRIGEARALLRAELERDPDGLWAEDTRVMLARLPEDDKDAPKER